MKRIIFILIVLTLGINTITDAQQSYQPLYPNYSMQLTKAGSNDPFGDLFTYDGSSTTNYEVGKISNTPTYKRGFYQWNINSNDIPTAAIIDSIVISFGAQYVNYQGSELNYFNCILDLSDPNLNKSALWNYSDRNQYTPIGSGQINTPPSNYVTQTHKFLNGSSFVNAFINSTQQTNRFTLGIAWKYEHPAAYNSYWRLTPLNLKVYFHMPIQTVTLDQRLSNNVQVSKLRKWEGSYFTPSPFINPGTPFNFTVGSTQTIQGDQAIHSNEKYHRWLRNQNDEQDVSNHHSFTIETFDNNFTSRFNPTHSGVKIQNSLEATGIDGGKLEFKDPWLIDYPDPDFGNTPRNRGMAAPFKELTTPYTFTYSSDYKGLFLDQSGPPLWTSSYYSLKMPDEQPITVHNQSRKFFPYSWEETGGVTIQYPWGQETGVVFNSSSNVATAVLKGQLMSKEQTGISSNSQRKMVRTDNGIYHVVYESMGSVWYTHSLTSNYFGDWSTDKNLQGRNPGIAYNGNKIIFVYETINLNNSQEAQIRIQPMTGYDVGGVWIYDGGNDNELVSTYSNTYFGNAKPVIAFTSGQIFVVYRKNATEGLKERTKWYTSGNWTWESEASIPQTNANSINPAVTGTFGNMHIVFESLATIQYKFAYNQGASWRYNNVLNLSSGSGFSQNYYPSISISDGDNLYVMVSWQGVYTSAMDKIAFKTDEYGLHRYAAVARVGYGASWGGFSNFSNYVKYTNNNSINALAGSILAWSENNGQVSLNTLNEEPTAYMIQLSRYQLTAFIR